MLRPLRAQPRSTIAFIGLGLLAACSDASSIADDPPTGRVQSSWTEYPGTPTFAAGWQLRQMFEGSKDSWQPSRSGAFVRGGTGWTYAFPKLENGAILGVTSRSSAPAQVDITTQLLGRSVGAATTSRGPAVLYDQYYYSHPGSWVSNAIRLGRLGAGGWTSELVDDAFSDNILTGLCLVNRGDRLVALYGLGYQHLKMAEERTTGGWDVRDLTAMGDGPFPLGCAGGTRDLWFVVGDDAYDPPHVVRLRVGDVTPSETTRLSSGPRLRAASTAVGSDDVPVVAYVDDDTVRLATRTADGTWNTEVVPIPFAAGKVGAQNIALSLASGSPVLAITRLGTHPTSPGVGKDEIWLLRQVEGAWRATQVYSPPGGWLRIHGMTIDADRVVVGLAHSKYGGPYRNVIIEGPLP